MRRLVLLSMFLLLGLSLSLPAAAQPAKNTETYKISEVFDARTRSAIAVTGADIFEVGHDYVLVEATGREARALRHLGLALTEFKTQITSLVDSREIWIVFDMNPAASTTSRPAAMFPGARTASPTPARAPSAPT